MQRGFSWKRLACLLSVLVFLSAMLPVVAYAAETGTVNTDKVILRQSNSKSSKAIKTMPKNAELTIHSKTGDWYKVTYGKVTGYVMAKFVTKTSSSTTSASASSSSKSSGSGSSTAKTTSTAVTVSSKLGKMPAATKKGDKGSDVKKLQQALALTGYYTGTADGDYGNGTVKAVKAFQKAKGLKQNGTANKTTLEKLWASKVTSSTTTSSSSSAKKTYTTEQLNWFKNGVNRIPKGATFEVKDVKTGKVFKAKRWSGANHIDAEPLTKSDTAKVKGIYGGFSWKRRAVLVKYNGHVYAASMNFYPHGTQTITNNDFEGHFCIHFYGSKTHGTQKVDSAHQNAVAQAMKATW